MGDVTYRHVFGSNDTTGDITSRQPPAMEASDDSLYGHVHSRAQQEALNASERQPGNGMTEAKCALRTSCKVHRCQCLRISRCMQFLVWRIH